MGNKISLFFTDVKNWLSGNTLTNAEWDKIHMSFLNHNYDLDNNIENEKDNIRVCDIR